MTTAAFIAPSESVEVSTRDFFEGVRGRLSGGAHLLTFYGQPGPETADLTLTAVFQEGGRIGVLRTTVDREHGYHSLTRDHPVVHIFEREIHEAHGVKPHDHPWLKPVRFPVSGSAAMNRHPFYVLEGKEVHEVAVGPIHAGVIEPGHFRFMCLGETVHHLEIHLGYQHRGVEGLLRRRDPRTATPLVETIAGDASVAHAWAQAGALEALAGLVPPEAVAVHRGIGLELERIGMHLAGLSGLANDVAFLQGASTYGRLRTTVINSTMLVCGSRFGRGWVRPGSIPAAIPAATAGQLRANLDLVERDVAIINRRFIGSTSVRHRLDGVGVVTCAQAAEIGMVGAAARASGVLLDQRAGAGAAPYRELPVEVVAEASGDCWARAMVRVREIDESIRWIRAALDSGAGLERCALRLGSLAPGTLAIGVQESWRGEVVHVLETDREGKLSAVRVQDPSLRNWHGLALAVRGQEISDFPICNKSFDLSYCGNDL